ncbi:hypothetical protein NDU88_001636 [Pleurodeles waltl]|uniref:Uncharacterized protein n=1 Tax=Pleurodeles waltl TaxID=8319 RepID=A0AAV7SC56_PLEWA|nr:hypothetical protein NDU88_001636 [Pleurodeles waltl]
MSQGSYLNRDKSKLGKEKDQEDSSVPSTNKFRCRANLRLSKIAKRQKVWLHSQRLLTIAKRQRVRLQDQCDVEMESYP